MAVRSLVLVAVAVAATQAAYPTDDELRQLVMPALQITSKRYNCSVGISFRSSNTTMSAAIGDINGQGKQATEDEMWVWGSVTKMSTGTSILQLVEQGVMKLDDTIPQFLDPWFAMVKPKNFSTCEDLWGPEVHTVTIQNLLSMKSGIPDFDTAKGFGPMMKDSFRAEVYAHPNDFYTPTELLNVPWVHTGKLKFTPGSRWAYSSTNFMLLGMILARHYKASGWTNFNQAVLFPPAMKPEFVNTTYADSGAPYNYTEVVGFDRTHYNGQSGTGQGISVYKTKGVFVGWTASNIVSPSRDVANLVYSIYGPEYRLIGKEYVDKMIPQGAFYGLATFNLSGFTGPYATSLGKGVAYGHLGATYGYQSIAAFFPGLNFSLAIATDIETDTQSQPATALCLSYNAIMARILNLDIHCDYIPSGYYGGNCNCTKNN